MLINGILGVVLMGVIQGITEFLPVSSSGHLVVGSQLCHLSEPSLLLDVLLHLGTLLPVLWLYRGDLGRMLLSLGDLKEPLHNWENNPGFLLMIWIVLGSITTAIIGALGHDLFVQLFSNPKAVGMAFLVTGAILFLSKFGKDEVFDRDKGFRTLTPLVAFSVGLAQGIAITPGISRSGATIATALLLGTERETAAKFSFLLSVPAIFGAILLEGAKTTLSDWSISMLAGTIAASIAGYIALRLVVQFVRRGKLHWFAYYLWPLGIGVLIYTFVS
ncbi:MAG: undecaprenyl-diphosphate phosphatase [Pseudomonadota bacterium]